MTSHLFLLAEFVHKIYDQNNTRCTGKLSTAEKVRVMAWQEEGILRTVIVGRLGRHGTSIKCLLSETSVLPYYTNSYREKLQNSFINHMKLRKNVRKWHDFYNPYYSWFNKNYNAIPLDFTEMYKLCSMFTSFLIKDFLYVSFHCVRRHSCQCLEKCLLFFPSQLCKGWRRKGVSAAALLGAGPPPPPPRGRARG